MKSAAGFRRTRHQGTARVGWMFTLTAAAYNLVQLPKLLGIPGWPWPEPVLNSAIR